MKFKFLLLISCLLFFCSSYSYAEVQEFSRYETNIKILNNNTLEISKKISLKNTHSVGFIPGEVEFNVGDEKLKLEILSVKSKDTYGNYIEHRVKNVNESRIIVLNVEYPVLPGFEYTFYLNYTLKIKPKGIFFKSIQIPTSQSSIPLENGELKIAIPDNNYFTYIQSKNNITQINKKQIKVDLDSTKIDTVNFEYSRIPISIFNIKGSLLFWGIINLVLVLILLRIIGSEIAKYQEEEEEIIEESTDEIISLQNKEDDEEEYVYF